MQTLRDETQSVRSSEDVLLARQAVRIFAVEQRFSLVDQTKIVTAASELARNTVEYGGGGTMRLLMLEDGGRRGVRLIFEDKGPGIADVEGAMRDGFTSGKGLGLGLSGAKRLSSEFAIESRLGEGTRVTITRWTS